MTTPKLAISSPAKRRFQLDRAIIVIAIASLVIAIIALIASKSWLISLITFFVALILLFVYNIFRLKIIETNKIRKMEEVFPDFIELVSSNLRSGMTVDKALLLSSRKEFSPLDLQILELGKDITTGKEINAALKNMADRIKSDKINKTIDLVISGLKAGGNLAVLLEETASNMREREFVEKRAASNVLMYVIFIFFAVALGGPILFGLSTVLVKVLTSLLANLPATQTVGNGLPFTLKSVSISSTFITYFAIIFMTLTDILASLLLGLVSKGDEKGGIRYMIPLFLVSITSYLIVNIVLSAYFKTIFS